MVILMPLLKQAWNKACNIQIMNNPPKQDENNPPLDENHIIAERREKLAKLRQTGVAYPMILSPRI